MKRYLLLLLTLVLCAGMVFAAGCNNQKDDEPSDDVPTDDIPESTDGETEPFSLMNEDGTSRYTILRSELKTTNDVLQSALALRRSMVSALGVQEVLIASDWEDGKPSEEEIAARYEILIGQTNRPESQQVLDSLEQYSYAIRVVGHKIVIVGDTDDGTIMAVEAFIANYLSDLGKVTASLNYYTTYTPLPTQIILKDNSNGKMNPQLVTTIYPTEDVVIADIIPTEMGYAVDPTGKADSTKGIQKALNDCHKNGGGTVYLPAGTYVVSDVIDVPAFVTLRGDWQDPDEGNEYGTVISVWTDPEDVGKPGLFNLGGSGGVLGLTVYYPHQSLSDVKPYGFAFYCTGQGSSYMLASVKNVTVINGYRGIGCCVAESNAHEQLTVENFKGTFLYCGTEVYNQADVGTWQNVTISNKYWKQANAELGMVAPDATALDAYTRANAVGLMLGDLEWTEFGSLLVEDCKIGIEIVQGKRIQFAGSLYDISVLNCAQGLVVHDLDARWGMLIARSTIENGIYNETRGMVKLCNVTTTGAKEGNVTTDDSDLSRYEVNYMATYQKPVAKLYVAELAKDGSDVSAALQAVLDEAGKTGGVVYLPAGTYCLENPISVPGGVELRGCSSLPQREQGGMSKGTMIRVIYGQGGDADDVAAVTLAPYAGVNGIRFQYWDNNGSIRETAYTVRGTGEGVYLINSEFMAAGRGVDFSGCDNHLIKKLTTFCFINDIRVGGEGGYVVGMLHNCTVMDRHGLPISYPDTEGYASNNDVARDYNATIIVENAKNETILNCFSYGVRNLIHQINSENTVAINIGADNIGRTSPQMLLEGGSFTGINILRYNGVSYQYANGTSVRLYNRLSINVRDENTVIVD